MFKSNSVIRTQHCIAPYTHTMVHPALLQLDFISRLYLALWLLILLAYHTCIFFPHHKTTRLLSCSLRESSKKKSFSFQSSSSAFSPTFRLKFSWFNINTCFDAVACFLSVFYHAHILGTVCYQLFLCVSFTSYFSCCFQQGTPEPHASVKDFTRAETWTFFQLLLLYSCTDL